MGGRWESMGGWRRKTGRTAANEEAGKAGIGESGDGWRTEWSGGAESWRGGHRSPEDLLGAYCEFQRSLTQKAPIWTSMRGYVRMDSGWVVNIVGIVGAPRRIRDSRRAVRDGVAMDRHGTCAALSMATPSLSLSLSVQDSPIQWLSNGSISFARSSFALSLFPLFASLVPPH